MSNPCSRIQLQLQLQSNTKMRTKNEKIDFHESTKSPLDLSGSENSELAIPTYRQMAQHWRSASPCVFRDQCPDHEAESSAVWLKKNSSSVTILRSLTKTMKFLYFLFRSGESENSSKNSRRGSSPEQIGPIMKFTNTQNRLMAAKRQAFAIEAITTVRL